MKFCLALSTACLLFASATQAQVDTDSAFSLKVLHINDHHSNLEPTSANLTIDDVVTGVELGGFPRVVSKIKQLDNSVDNVLKLHAGDAITGTLYFTLFEGEADAAMMNQVCFDAFALGNHEFDRGDAGLKKFLEALQQGSCVDKTAVLSANVRPQAGVSPLAPDADGGPFQSFAPYTIKKYKVGETQVPNEFNEMVTQNVYEQVGIVGLVIANKTKQSSNPDETTQFLDELETAQTYIDELRFEKGVNKIVVLSHYQYANEVQLAQALDGVDVIVGGDSHSLLGDFAKFGLPSVGDYPTKVLDKNGRNVCVVQAWQYSTLVGELNIDFDENGDVVNCVGTPHLLVGDQFEQNDVQLTGSAREQMIGRLYDEQNVSVTEPDAQTATLLQQYKDEVDVLSQTIIGQAAQDLCLERIPGQGRSQICPVEATAQNGSDISNIVALAFKEQSKAQIAIQNAGGVRTDIARGDISIEDAYTLLPFANTLVILTMTGQEIVDVLEEGLDFALSPDGSSGAYPYASGLRFHVNVGQPMGQRISQVEVKLPDDATWSEIDLTRSYSVVTNSFVAAGRDGYLTFGTVSDEGRVEDTFLDYAQAFVDYVRRVEEVEKLPIADYSTQSYRNDSAPPEDDGNREALITINSQQELTPLNNNCDALASLFAQYETVELKTRNGNWIGDVCLPESVVENSRFILNRNAAYSTDVHVNGHIVNVKRNAKIEYLFTQGKWVKQDNQAVRIDWRKSVKQLSDAQQLATLLNAYDKVEAVLYNGVWVRDVRLPTTAREGQVVHVARYSGYGVTVHVNNRRDRLRYRQQAKYEFSKGRWRKRR